MSKEELDRIRAKMRPLSKEAQEARRPQKPEDLVDALQDPIHRDVGRSRAVRVVRSEN